MATEGGRELELGEWFWGGGWGGSRCLNRLRVWDIEHDSYRECTGTI